MKRIIITATSVFLILTSTASFAYDGNGGGYIMADALLVRPVSLVGIALGTAVFIISLPVAAISGSVDKAACELVVKPVRFTFTRPLGELGQMGYYETGGDCPPGSYCDPER
jgi:hypothetical protein